MKAKTCFILIVFGLFLNLSHAKIYKWVDENGKTHYGDKPPKKLQMLKKLILIPRN